MSNPVARATALLLGGFVLLWLGQATVAPPRVPDAPEQTAFVLDAQAAYDSERFQLRLRWPAPRPQVVHTLLRYDGDDWEQIGPGDTDAPIGEDRFGMLLDDGRVPGFDRYGGFMLIGDGIRFMPGAAGPDEVAAHPYLGGERGRSDVRKYLPSTRASGVWHDLVDGDALRAQRAAGQFVDLWHWRAHRGNPVGAGDSLHVAEHRWGDSGRSSYADNLDEDRGQPRYMFDPDAAGSAAWDWDDVAAGRIGPDDVHHLGPGTAAPFDPDRDWQPGDTLPAHVLREPEGSRAAIGADAVWADGHWTLTLNRALDTGHADEDKVLAPGGMFHVAFAVHRDGASGRHHHVSLPFTLGLSRDDATLNALTFDGDAPAWTQPATPVRLFYPGEMNWPAVNAARHAGAAQVGGGVPVQAWHDERRLAGYALEAEAGAALRWQWLLTLLAGTGLILAGWFSLDRALRAVNR